VRVVLSCSLGGAGHLQPIVEVGRQLHRSGHDVSLLVPPALERAAADSGLATDVGLEPPRAVVESYRDRIHVKGLIDRELFAELCTAAMLPAATDLLDCERPTLVLREPTEYASAVAAVLAGIPFGTIAISQARIEHGVLAMVAPIIDRFGLGTSVAISSAPFLSSFPGSLDPSPWRSTARYRLHEDVPLPLPDWWATTSGPLLYVTFGSVVGHTDLSQQVFRAAFDAVADLPVRVLVTVGRTVEPTLLDPVPPSVHVERWVPQAQVLAACDAVVCHGGSGTTFGALRAGVPLVVCPLYADNARNGEVVERSGAGLVVSSSSRHQASPLPSLSPTVLRAAIERVLAEASFTLAARAIRDEMAAYPPADEVATSLDWAPSS
jgi:UDP:flavonoid glycosyltransferase YjiC (YdhE family)